MSVNITHDHVTAIVYGVYSIRDVKTNVYNTPFYQTHKAGAMRLFSDLCTDPQSTIKKHPEDFQLFQIGTFNSETAEYQSMDPFYLASPSDFQQ